VCNPRRIRVQVTRQLTENWRHAVTRRATAQGTAVAEARIREPLDQSIGGPTLTALMRVLDESDGWREQEDGTFHHPLTDGDLYYHPDERVLEIVARVAEDVEADVSAEEVLEGQVAEELEAEGVGTYYTDGWLGTSPETAQAQAQKAAQAALDAKTRARIDDERAAAERERGDDVARLADERARREVEQLMARRGEELHDAAAERLLLVGIQGRNIFNRSLKAAIRDVLLAHARSRGAHGVSVVDRDGVLEIQFEIDV